MNSLANPAKRSVKQPDRHLTKDGVAVRDANHLTLLRLLHRHGVLRCHDVALGLFPARSKAAATAAALRTLGSGVSAGTVAMRRCSKTRYVYYALSEAGARVLRLEDPDEAWKSGVRLLARAGKPGNQLVHGEWSALLAIAAQAKGVEALSEYGLYQRYGSRIEDWCGRMPDALSFRQSGSTPLLVWHEVEASRRSTTASKDAQRHAAQRGRDALSGREKLRQLLQMLWRLGVCDLFGERRLMALALHCASEKIERECIAVLKSVFGENLQSFAEEDEGERYYQVESGILHGAVDARFKRLPFGIYVLRLPTTPTDVWTDTPGFPLPGDETKVTVRANEDYLTPPARRASTGFDDQSCPVGAAAA